METQHSLEQNAEMQRVGDTTQTITDTDVFLQQNDQMGSAQQEKHTIKYNGEDINLPLPEILTLAQKGMNYDKVYSRLQEQQTNVAALLPQSNVEEALQQAEDNQQQNFLQLLQSYPDLEELPPAAAKLVSEGVPPLYAYENYLNGVLKAQIGALKAEVSNQKTTPGSAIGIGGTQEKDPFLQGFESMMGY